jgi:hypothetical protein
MRYARVGAKRGCSAPYIRTSGGKFHEKKRAPANSFDSELGERHPPLKKKRPSSRERLFPAAERQALALLPAELADLATCGVKFTRIPTSFGATRAGGGCDVVRSEGGAGDRHGLILFSAFVGSSFGFG